MKKGWLFLLIIVLLIGCAARAEDPEWVYSYNAGGIGIYNGKGGDVTVPDTVEGRPTLALGNAVFTNNAEITALTLPGTVRSIGRSCINNCANLERVTLPEGLQVITYNNLEMLPKLTELTIPASVVLIDYSIGWNENLQTITFLGECPVFAHPDFCLSVLPEDMLVLVPDDQVEAYRAAITNVPAERIQPSGKNAVKYDWTPAPGELSFDAATGTVTGYSGDNVRVDIPREIDGTVVRAIGDSAFADSSLAYITLPEGVETIESMAFDGAGRLQVVKLPDTLKTIGSYAFNSTDCAMLAWGQGLESIGDRAFRYTDLGSDVRLPESLREIGEEAFKGATLRDLYIGGSITRIGPGAFTSTNLHYLELNAYDMVEVGEGAFAGTRLEDIDLPWDCSQENQKAWQALLDSQKEGCKVWINNPADCETPDRGTDEYAQYPDGTLYLSAYTGEQTALTLWHTWDDVAVTGVGDGVFKGNQTLKTFRATHSDRFTAIGAEAFAGSAIETADLYYTTETIGAGAFRDCLGLTEITLPASLKSVGAGAFAGCKNLKDVAILCDPAILPADAFDGTAYAAVPVIEMPFAANPESDFEFDAERGMITSYVGTAVDVVIPREIGGVPVRAIRQNAFDCARDYTDTDVATNRTSWLPLRSVVIPETVETVEDSAFAYCQQLQLVLCYAPLESTGRATFMTCRALQNVVFVNGVRQIDNYAFERCEALASVYWGDHLRRIGENAFNRCGLEELVIDAEIVDTGAFNHSALRSVVLTDRVREIHSAAFYACEQLTFIGCRFSEAERFVDGGPTGGIPQEGVTTVFPETTTDDQLKALNAKLNVWNGGHLGGGNTITLRETAAEMPALPDAEALWQAVTAEPQATETPAPTPAPVPTLAPAELPAPIGDISAVLGGWKLSKMAEGGEEYDASMFGLDITLLLNADGTAVMKTEEDTDLTWRLQEGVLFVTDGEDDIPAGLDEAGRLVLAQSGIRMVFVRGKETPAVETAPNDGSVDLSALRGVWYAVLIDAGVEPMDAHGLDMRLEIGEDGTAYDSFDDITLPIFVQDGVAAFNGQRLTLRGDGRLMRGDTIGGAIYYSRDPDDVMPLDALPTPEPVVTELVTPPPVTMQVRGGIRTDVRYTATSYSASGMTMDAMYLPGEYSLTFRANGQCDFVMGGAAVTGTTWRQNEDGTLTVDYMGMGAMLYTAVPLENAVELDMNGMVLHYEPQE